MRNLCVERTTGRGRTESSPLLNEVFVRAGSMNCAEALTYTHTHTGAQLDRIDVSAKLTPYGVPAVGWSDNLQLTPTEKLNLTPQE